MKIVLCFCLFPFLSSGAFAGSLSLFEAIQRAWEAAPQLKAQERQAGLAAADRWRRFVPNEPQAQYSSTDNGTAEVWGLSETLAFPGKSLAFINLDRAQEESQRAEWAAKRYELSQAVAQAYLDWASSEAQIQTQDQAIHDQADLVQTLQQRFETGHGAQAHEDFTLAELQLLQARADRDALEDKAHSALRRLKKLLGAAASEEFSCELPNDVDPALLRALGPDTADQARAKAALAVAQANERLSLWQQVPDLNLGISRNQYDYLPGSPSGLETTYSYSVSVTLPLLFPLREWAEKERASNQAILDQAVAHTQLLNADADQEDAAREYRRSRARLEEIRRKDLPLARALQKSALALYRAGKLGFADLSLARQTLAGLVTQEIQLRASIVSAHLRALGRAEEPQP